MAVDKLLRGIATSPKKLHLLQNAPGLRGKAITPISEDGLLQFLQSIALSLNNQHSDDPFYVFDLAVLVRLMDRWTRSLPAVRPFYAVKCNPDPALLGAMAALGSNFDCASRAEIEAVLALGVSPDRIVFANPCKAESHIKFAASVGVNLTTFDSIEEVEKMRPCHPKSALLIRIQPPEEGGARCPLGTKFGALPDEITPLLQAAKDANLAVAGVSFHVGGGATKAGTYSAAIAAAKGAFETAIGLGLPPMNVLNIGGGFSGHCFDGAAAAGVGGRRLAGLSEYGCLHCGGGIQFQWLLYGGDQDIPCLFEFQNGGLLN
ncbi:ornithine decarboxylase-like [Momordica charantia]|uniref:ornithine decarboxylase n=1 Tax=Momordica charantia TaxID=3673 RepID=A0A6J1CSV6_MOMCH|nr:ornithine decarboxylase-like [Momordica charantia]